VPSHGYRTQDEITGSEAQVLVRSRSKRRQSNRKHYRLHTEIVPNASSSNRSSNIFVVEGQKSLCRKTLLQLIPKAATAITSNAEIYQFKFVEVRYIFSQTISGHFKCFTTTGISHINSINRTWTYRDTDTPIQTQILVNSIVLSRLYQRCKFTNV
jgi:hypothetical protein